jgi:DHA2 family multidrug resistance protein-like MFS transporter
LADGQDGMNAPTPERTELKGRALFVAATALSLGTILTVIDGAIASVALPTIARDLHVDNSSVVLVVTIYQLMLVMLLFPFSGIAERIGIKRVYQGGQLLFTVATALCFFAKSLPFLLLVRALQATGAAASLSVLSAMIRLIYPANRLGRGLGLNAVMVSIAGAMAPTIGGLIISVAPWPWVFMAAAPFGVLSLWLGRQSLPESQPRHSQYDLAGALLNMATFGLLISGLQVSVHGGGLGIGLGLIVAGVVLGFVLVRHELRVTSPILPVDLLADPIISLSAGGALLVFVGQMLLTLSLPFRLQHSYGFSPGEVGAMIAPWPAALMIANPVAGALSDRVPAGLLGAIGMALTTTMMIFLALLPAHPTYFDLAWRMALCGAGVGLYIAPNGRLIVGSAPRGRTASAGGIVGTVRLTGQALGATLVAMLLAWNLGTTRVPGLIGAALTGTACLCSLLRLNPSVRRPRVEPVSDGKVGAA